MKRSLIALMIIAAFLAGCAPGQSPEQIQSQINTAVAQTLEAERQVAESVELTVAAQIPLATATVEVVPTNTPITIPTFTPVVPTVTAMPVIPPSVSSGGSVAVSKPDYACDVINRRPHDMTEIHHGDSFDIKWTIVNTGTKTWDAGYDVKYFSGPKMATVNIVEIPKQMKPGDTYQIVMDANAPAETGRQVMTWTVQGQACFPYVAIDVK